MVAPATLTLEATTIPKLTDRAKIGGRDGEVNLLRNDVMMFWSVCSVKRVEPEPTDAQRRACCAALSIQNQSTAAAAEPNWARCPLLDRCRG